MAEHSHNAAGRGQGGAASNADSVQSIVDRWTGLFESIPNIVLTTDVNGTIELVNHTIPALTPEEVVGRSIYDFVNTADLERVRAIIGEVIATGQRRTYTTEAREDLETAHYAVSVGPILDEGEVTGLTVVLTDITQLKETADDLRQGEGRLRQVIDLVPHYIFAKDEEGRFILSNEANARAFKMTVEEVTGQKHQDLHPVPEEVRDMRADDLEVIRSGRPKFIPEEPFTDQHGNKLWLQTIKIPYTQAGSGKKAILGVAIDITERKKVEEQLRENQHRLVEAQRIARLGNWHVDFTTGSLVWSDEIFRIMGWDVETTTVTSEAFYSAVHPDDRQSLRETTDTAQATGTDYSHEYRIVRPDGEIRHVLERAEVLSDDTGRALRMVGTIQDITERKNAILALQQSETRLQLLMSQIPAVLWSVDKDLRYTYSSGSGLEHMDLRPQEVVGMDLYEYFDTSDPQFLPIQMHLRALTGRRESYHFEWLGRHYQVNLAPLFDHKTGDVVGCIGVALDVTERVGVEQALAASEERLKLAIRAARDGILDWTPDDDRMVVNEYFAEMLGLEPGDVPSTYREMKTLVHPDDLSKLESELAMLATGKKSFLNHEFRFKRSDGSWIWVLAKGQVVSRDSNGRPSRLAGTVKDITERKKAELAQANAMASLEATMNALPDLMFEIDEDGTILEYRSPRKGMLLLEPEEFLNQKIADVFPRSAVATVSRALREAAQYGSHHGSVYSLEYPNDDIRWFELSLAAKKRTNDQGTRFVALVRDITDRYRAEERLKETTAQLRKESEELTEKNIALRQILNHLDTERADYKRSISQSVEMATKDILRKVRRRIDDEYASEIDNLETELSAILSRDIDEFSQRLGRLTPREREICSLIRKGLSSKEISDNLNLSLFTIHKHREQIRKKLGITNKDINLNTYLKSRDFPADT